MARSTNTSTTIMQNNAVTNPALNRASKYYVHPSEEPDFVIVSPKLDGSSYLAWTRPMHIALGAKNKFQFVDGSIPIPALQDPNRTCGNVATILFIHGSRILLVLKFHNLSSLY